MTGQVITNGLVKDSIESGMLAVLWSDGHMQVCTVDHIDPDGSWVVSGDDLSSHKMTPEEILCKLMVTDGNKAYPLKFNQWNKSIKMGEVNTGKKVTFEVVPMKFKKGTYLTECGLCGSHFQAAKRQAVCFGCCQENVTAKIVVGKANVKPDTKKKLLIPGDVARQIAYNAFEAGGSGMPIDMFDSWYENQLQDGRNIDDN